MTDLNVPDENTRHYAYDPKFMALLAETWSNAIKTGPAPDILATNVQSLNINRNDGLCQLGSKNLNLLDERHRMKPFSRGPYNTASITIRETTRG